MPKGVYYRSPELRERLKKRLLTLRRNTTTHGMSGTRIYSIWNAMKGRCYNPNDPDYSNYGGRGIKVCDDWLDFEAFYSDMGKKPPKLSLDRKDVNGNYEFNNCHWVTQERQCNNKRNNRRITIGDRTQTIADWAREHGMSRHTLKWRINSGWPVSEWFELAKEAA